jgi:outer membrane autotransporter protein
VAFGYVHGNTFTHSLPVHGQFDSYQAVLYGRYTAGRYWFRQALGYARNIDEMRRDITFTEVPRRATGGAHGNQFFTALRTGVDLPLAMPGVLSPFAGAELQSVKLSGTTETGADSVNLVLPSRTTHSVRSLLGTEWRHLFDGPGGAWRIDAAAAWVHTFGTNTLAIDARYAGAPATSFTVHGSGQSRNAAQLRLGMSVSPTPRSRLSIRYDGELGTHGSTHGGALGFSYHW